MNRLEQNQETNILIAKFLNMETMQRGSRGWEQCIFSFHHSWDSLMLAVEKIEQTSFDITGTYEDVVINGASCMIEVGDFSTSVVESSKIEATYNAVIQFIKWYNENK